MKNVAVIGLGNLGRRHLEALLAFAEDFFIYGVEINKDVLPELHDRYPAAIIVGSIEYLPPIIEVCVIATSAEPRYKVFEQLIAHSTVKNVVLEKVLFQKSDDYNSVNELLKEKGYNAWINCVRREWTEYQNLKEKLKNETIKSVCVSGGEWGLCCNSIHMIDLVQYLTESETIVAINATMVPGIYDSKRYGYKEMYGTINVVFDNGVIEQITCTRGGSIPTMISINSDNYQIIIEESKGIIRVASKENDWQWESTGFNVEYQSGLTGNVTKNIIDNGKCNLPKYEIYMETHRKYIEMWIGEFQKQGWESDICPIT